MRSTQLSYSSGWVYANFMKFTLTFVTSATNKLLLFLAVHCPHCVFYTCYGLSEANKTHYTLRYLNYIFLTLINTRARACTLTESLLLNQRLSKEEMFNTILYLKKKWSCTLLTLFIFEGYLSSSSSKTLCKQQTRWRQISIKRK